MFLKKHSLGKLFFCLILTMFLGFGSLIAIMPQSAEAATTSVTITKLASDKETVLAQKTVTYQWLRDSGEIEVMGDGSTHYYHQGPVFIDHPDDLEEQERLRWNEAEDTNWDTKDMGAVRGTSVIDLCKMVGGMKAGDKLRVKGTDGLYRDFAYENVYEYDINREGPMVLTWETCWDKGVVDVRTGYQDGMRLVWFAAATPKVGPTSIEGLPSGDYHVFGNWDWHEAADPEYWYYFSGEYPTTTGLSVKIVSDLIIYSNEPVPEVPVADFTADTASGIAPLTVNFTDKSIGTAPLTYEWDFDNDGTVDSTEQNPTYEYTEAGTYTVKLTVTNANGSDSEVKTDYITVTEPVAPVADFTADQTLGNAPLTIQFTDQSTNSPTSWAWDFDNDGVIDSTEQNPTYEYTAAGTYSVTLTATNAAGSDDEIKADYITVAAAGPKTWYVGKSGDVHYNTVQAAVTAANAGDTIIVKDGTYTENVLVEKSLVIQSENGADLTTVRAANTGADVFKVTAGNVTIDGFTVSGATGTDKSGIAISGTTSGSCTIINNKCSGNNRGISITSTKNNTVTNNTCTLSGKYALYLSNTTENFITGNTCSNNTAGSGHGLTLWDNANNNTVSGNILASNNMGIRVKNAHSNIIFNNTFSKNDCGLEIATGSINNVFYLNNLIDNTTQLSTGFRAVAGNLWNSEATILYSFNGKQYNGFLGNCWGDYTGTDADGNGIGDTSYQTVMGDSDSYPLMGQWNDGVITGSGPVTYTVTFSAGENGTLSATVDDVAINSGDEVEEGKDVVFTATPADGYQVATFTVGGVDKKAELVEGKYTFTITADTEVAVTYEAIPATQYTLTLTGEGLTSNPAAGAIDENTSVTITVAPAEGQQVATFTVGGVDKKAKLIEGKYTFTITADTEVAVTYEDIPAPLLQSIKITTPPTKTAYTVGEELDLTGLVVTGTYNDESTAIIEITADMISGFDSSAVAVDQVVTVTVEGKTATFNVTIKEAATPAPEYTVTFSVTPEGATVVVKDSEKNVIAAEADGTYKLEAGEYSYTVSAEGYVTKDETFTVVDVAQTVTVILEEETVQPDTPQYNVIPLEDAIYTIGKTAEGIKNMTVNAGQTGLNYFTVSVEPIKAHEGTETIVFTHLRNGVQLELNALVADFDEVNTGKAGFNVNPGDVVKVYIVDQLTNDDDQNPVVFNK